MNLNFLKLDNLEPIEEKNKNKKNKNNLELVFLDILNELKSKFTDKALSVANNKTNSLDISKLEGKNIKLKNFPFDKQRKISKKLNKNTTKNGLFKSNQSNLHKLSDKELHIQKKKTNPDIKTNSLDISKLEGKNIKLKNFPFDEQLKVSKKDNLKIELSRFIDNSFDIINSKKMNFLIPFNENEKLTISIDKINNSINVKVFTESKIDINLGSFNNLIKVLNSIGFNNVAFSHYMLNQNQSEQKNSLFFKKAIKSRKGIGIKEANSNLNNFYIKTQTSVNITV